MRRALPAPKQALEYQEKPPAKRRWARWVVAGVIALLTLLIIARAGPVAWRQLRLLALQRQCLTYNAPAGSVVATIPGGAGSPLPQWQALYTEVSGNPLQSSGTVFLHEMISTDGDRRLVAVDVSWRFIAGELDVAYTARVIGLGTPFASPTEIFDEWNPMAVVVVGKVAPEDRIQVLAGQGDPEDPSHFVLTITRGAETFACDGWLLHNDKVVIQQRLTSPSTQQIEIPISPTVD